MSAEELLTIINDSPTMSPHTDIIEEYLTKQEFDDWKVFEKDDPMKEINEEDREVTSIRERYWPLFRDASMRLGKAQKYGNRTGNHTRAVAAANELESIFERYCESIEELDPGSTISMVQVDANTPGAPEYIAQFLSIGDSVLIPRSWATGVFKAAAGNAGTKFPPPKPARREKLIEFLEMVISGEYQPQTVDDLNLAAGVARLKQQMSKRKSASSSKGISLIQELVEKHKKEHGS